MYSPAKNEMKVSFLCAQVNYLPSSCMSMEIKFVSFHSITEDIFVTPAGTYTALKPTLSSIYISFSIMNDRLCWTRNISIIKTGAFTLV